MSRRPLGGGSKPAGGRPPGKHLWTGGATGCPQVPIPGRRSYPAAACWSADDGQGAGPVPQAPPRRGRGGGCPAQVSCTGPLGLWSLASSLWPGLLAASLPPSYRPTSLSSSLSPPPPGLPSSFACLPACFCSDTHNKHHLGLRPCRTAPSGPLPTAPGTWHLRALSLGNASVRQPRREPGAPRERQQQARGSVPSPPRAHLGLAPWAALPGRWQPD